MLTSAARFLSFLFHPLLLTSLLLGTLYITIPEVIRPVDPASIRKVLLVVFTLTFIIPFCSIVVMKLLGSIDSLYMRNRHERLMPFFFIGSYYAVTTYLFLTKLPFSEALVAVFFGVTLVIFMIFIQTFFLKVSIHAAGIWGLVGFLLALHLRVPVAGLFIPVMVSLLIAGLVTSSRLYLNEHSPAEVYSGAVTGFVVCFLTMYLMI